MERDIDLNAAKAICKISTHTLTWSVTLVWCCLIQLVKNFNSHAHVERDRLVFQLFTLRNRDFNSHAHVERDIMDKETWLTADDFNSHAHVERDVQGYICRYGWTGNFNSHAHVERDIAVLLKNSQTWYFNSHAHVERDRSDLVRACIRPISTHTLTWSVTGRVLKCPDSMDISTHTLTWSVTEQGGFKHSDRIISTHTLTWSVTFTI